MSDRVAEIHINMQGRVIVRYEGGKCVDVTDTRGRKLYSAQAQSGEGESVGWQYQHEDTGRTTFVTHAEAAAFEELNPRWYKAMQLYTAPPAAKINTQCVTCCWAANEWAIDVLTEAKEIFEAQADDIDPSLMDVAHRCFCAINGLQQAAAAQEQK